MTEYRITGDHHQSHTSDTWYWYWRAVRTEPNVHGVVVNYEVNTGAEPWHWLAILKGYWFVWTDRYHQRQKSKPIDILIGGKK